MRSTDEPPDGRPRVIAAGLAVVVLAGVALWAWSALRPATADELIDGITVTANVEGSSLGATQAIADFGLEEGIRMVPVRIVEDLALEVRLETPRDVVLAGAPRLCLTGPFWNPLDAGLDDRCWGDPDLAALLARPCRPTRTAGSRSEPVRRSCSGRPRAGRRALRLPAGRLAARGRCRAGHRRRDAPAPGHHQGAVDGAPRGGRRAGVAQQQRHALLQLHGRGLHAPGRARDRRGAEQATGPDRVGTAARSETVRPHHRVSRPRSNPR